MFARQSNKVSEKQPAAPIVQQESAPSIKNWTGASPDEVAKAFTEATTHEERLKWVRHPEKVEALMAEFYTNGAGAAEKIKKVVRADVANTSSDLYIRFSVIMQNAPNRTLSVLINEGFAKVDFKSYARFGSASWDDLLSGSATEAAEVRVMVEPTSYYNFGFADERAWYGLIATSPDLQDPVYLYVSQQDRSVKSLRSLVPGKARPMTLGIRSSGESHLQRQFEVTRVIRGSWIVNE